MGGLISRCCPAAIDREAEPRVIRDFNCDHIRQETLSIEADPQTLFPLAVIISLLLQNKYYENY